VRALNSILSKGNHSVRPIPLALSLGMLSLALAISLWIAVTPRKALHVLLWGQRLPEWRVFTTRIIAIVVTLSIVEVLVRWAITGVAP
jgi:hypothetical protein